MASKQGMALDREKLAVVVGYLVTGVWVISFVADIALKAYDPSPFLHAIMMTVVGALFGGQLVKKKEDK